MLLTIAALAASAVTATTDPSAALSRHDPRPRPVRHASWRTPGVRVWISGSDLRRRGDRVQVYYRTERDAYVTIFRIDTDGRVQLLFPRDPHEENYGYGGATYSVSNYDRQSAFYVDDYPGVGYLFAVASTEPFNYDPILSAGRWDLHVVSDGRIHGDPRTEMEEIVVQLMGQDYEDFDTHLLPYYVEQRYDYPRFVCYDCHTYTPYVYWDPYLAWCRRFTLVVFNDPYYYYPSYWYPTRYYGGRYYGGTRVVYTQPRGGRFIFKTRDNNSSPGVDYRDRRTTQTASGDRRTVDDRGVRGIDVGGRGSVPAPRQPTRRVAPELGGDDRGDRPDARARAWLKTATRRWSAAVIPGAAPRMAATSSSRRARAPAKAAGAVSTTSRASRSFPRRAATVRAARAAANRAAARLPRQRPSDAGTGRKPARRGPTTNRRPPGCSAAWRTARTSGSSRVPGASGSATKCAATLRPAGATHHGSSGAVRRRMNRGRSRLRSAKPLRSVKRRPSGKRRSSASRGPRSVRPVRPARPGRRVRRQRGPSRARRAARLRAAARVGPVAAARVVPRAAGHKATSATFRRARP